MTGVHCHFVEVQGATVCVVEVEPSETPVWANTSKGAQVFFRRIANTTRSVPPAEANTFIRKRF